MSTYTHTCLLFICFSFALPCQTATAGDKIVSPESINGTTIVAAEGLIELATQQPQLVMIDSRITADRKEDFIKGSISLPDTDTRCKSLAQAVPALNSPLLFYCNGVKCGRRQQGGHDCSCMWLQQYLLVSQWHGRMAEERISASTINCCNKPTAVPSSAQFM